MSITVLIPILILILIAVGIGWLVTSEKATLGTVESALVNLFDLESFKVDTSIEADVQITVEGVQQQLKASIGVTGAVDGLNTEIPKASAVIDVGFSVEGMEFSMAGEIRSFGQDIYLKLTTLPAFLPFFQGLEASKDQWFKFEGEKLQEMAESTSITAPSTEKAAEIFKDILDLLQGKKLFEIEQDLGKEKLNGKTADHYLVSLQKETVKELIPEFLQDMEKYIPEAQKEEYESNLQKTLQDFPQKFDDAWQKIGGLTFEIWVERDILRKFKWEREIDLALFEQLQTQIEQGIVTLVVECQFSDFDEKFEIEEPTDFKLFEELFSAATIFETPELSLPEYPAGYSPEIEYLPEFENLPELPEFIPE